MPERLRYHLHHDREALSTCLRIFLDQIECHLRANSFGAGLIARIGGVAFIHRFTIPVLKPCMGQSIAEGIVAKWHKGSGEPVKAQEVLVDVASDKIAIEVSSPADGTDASMLFGEGELADVATAIATIETESEVFGGESVVTSQRDLTKIDSRCWRATAN